MIVKVCGMRDAENIREVRSLGIDMMGFIFWPKSPRFVQMISSDAGIIPDYSEERLRKAAGMPKGADSAQPQVQSSKFKVQSQQSNGSDPQPLTLGGAEHEVESPKRVGVFVDEMPQTIVTYVYNYMLDYVQLHGQESRTMIENLKRTLIPDIAPHIKIIKALSISSAEDVARYKEYEGAVDLFLFDTKAPSVGGSGQQFDWQVLDAYDGDTPFLLSGGIGPDDAERIKAMTHPKFLGVDLNSRFETAPGVKDVELLRQFIGRIRA